MIQTQIPIPIPAAELEQLIRQEVQQKLKNDHHPKAYYEQQIGITNFSKWLKGNRSYSQEKQILISNYFKIKILIEIGGKKYELFQPPKQTQNPK